MSAAADTATSVREAVILRAQRGQLTWTQAAVLVGVTPRHMRRLKRRYEQHGRDGLRDHRLDGHGRRDPLPDALREQVCQLKREQYADLPVAQFHRVARETHDINVSYSWLLAVLQQAGLVERASRPSGGRGLRGTSPGHRVHLVGTTRRWLNTISDSWTLIIALDEGSRVVLTARLVPERGPLALASVLYDVLSHYGRFGELCVAPELLSRAADDSSAAAEQLFGALRSIGTEAVDCPPDAARQRAAVLQDLTALLTETIGRAQLSSYERLDTHLRDVLVAAYNRRIAGRFPQRKESMFEEVVGVDPRRLLTIRTPVTLSSDLKVELAGRTLRLPRLFSSLVGETVELHAFGDGTFAAMHQHTLVALSKQEQDAESQRKAQLLQPAADVSSLAG